MKKSLVILVVVVFAGWFIYSYKANDTAYVISDHLVVKGDYTVNKKTALKNNAVMEVLGTLFINKDLVCDGGDLLIRANKVVVNGKLECQDQSDASGVFPSGSITVVAHQGITFAKDSEVRSRGHVQIVSSDEKILSLEKIAAVYEETISDAGEGTRIGPFVDKAETMTVHGVQSSTVTKDGFTLVHRAYAQAPTDKEGADVENVVIGGTWHIGNGEVPPSGLQVPTPPKKVKNVLLYFDFGSQGNVAIKDFHLVGPDGRDGASDEKASCNAKGEDGEDAFRMRVKARAITLDTFRLELGSGGVGGAAITKTDCDNGTAKGGKGGAAGNFKFTADEDIVINSFHIVPGHGGEGGEADATGKDGVDGCPGVKGGDATAVGGDGGMNKKELSANGSVVGIDTITIDTVYGGTGGEANVHPGKGGNGNACNCGGGKGGNGNATGGKGGDASLKIVGTAGSAIGGSAGEVESRGGAGGSGGMCPLKSSGGNGGKGGDASVTIGKGGVGTTENGRDSEVEDQIGGAGGNGGDGCGPGKGGKGGSGIPNGPDGVDGARKCPDTEKKTEVMISPSGTPVTPPPAISEKKVKVILYKNAHLPVDQLIIENEVGCGADHWHAAKGVVRSVEGQFVPDPGPQCGYGKVKDNPTFDFGIKNQ